MHYSIASIYPSITEITSPCTLPFTFRRRASNFYYYKGNRTVDGISLFNDPNVDVKMISGSPEKVVMKYTGNNTIQFVSGYEKLYVVSMDSNGTKYRLGFGYLIFVSSLPELFTIFNL